MTFGKDDPCDSEEYQRFISEQAAHCRCTRGPCDGVLAGGQCDEWIDDKEDDGWTCIDDDDDWS